MLNIIISPIYGYFNLIFRRSSHLVVQQEDSCSCFNFHFFLYPIAAYLIISCPIFLLMISTVFIFSGFDMFFSHRLVRFGGTQVAVWKNFFMSETGSNRNEPGQCEVSNTFFFALPDLVRTQIFPKIFTKLIITYNDVYENQINLFKEFYKIQ